MTLGDSYYLFPFYKWGKLWPNVRHVVRWQSWGHEASSLILNQYPTTLGKRVFPVHWWAQRFSANLGAAYHWP